MTSSAVSARFQMAISSKSPTIASAGKSERPPEPINKGALFEILNELLKVLLSNSTPFRYILSKLPEIMKTAWDQTPLVMSLEEFLFS